ncbi:hypothetical protein ACOSQ4_030449 [Xanthoceras sorbifolium]
MLRMCYSLRKLPSNFGYLIKLRHFNIKGAILIKEMPSGMKELESLQKLSNFIVGKGVGSNLKDLKSLKMLRGQLCISGLENVSDCVPTDLILGDKKDLKVLLLVWGSQFDDSRNEVAEKNVLEMLRPHQQMEKITITCYGGTSFPSWVGHASFINITVLRLQSCEKCTSLPSLGLLTLLKDLTIKGMKVIKCIGSEIYGDEKPFQSLKTLCFEDLSEWENWEPNKENKYVDAFSCLQELSIVDCPKLFGRLPDRLPSLEKLVIKNCPKLFGRLPDRLPSLEKLVIKNCEKLVVSSPSLPVLCELEIDGCRGLACNSPVDFKSLKSMTLADISEFDDWLRQQNFLQIERVQLKIMGSEQLKNLWQLNETFLQKPPKGLQSFISITKLRIENCSNLVSFPEVCFLFNLSELEIIDCNALSSLPSGMNCKNACLGSLNVENCNSLTFIVRGQLPSSVKRLEIQSCRKLEYLWDDKEESCTSLVGDENSDNTSTSLLEYLKVRLCRSLRCLSSSGQLPEALQHLYVERCSQLSMLLSSSGQLPKALCTLSVLHVPKLQSVAESFRNNKALEEIKIWVCESLKTIPEGLHNLCHLQKITILGCRSIECFAEEGLPSTKLSEVHIGYCGKLKSLPNRFHGLNSLRTLSLGGCGSMTSFPEQGFPTNLTSLLIYGDVKIYKQLLEWGLHKLTSLTSLLIYGLPEAESFPHQEMEMTFPPSLTHLYIYKFPNLKCLMGEGFRNLNSLEGLKIFGCRNFTSFPKLALPSSLKILGISNCPNFKYFSKMGLPSSLLHLNISNCPKLKEECKRDKGKEWSKISHIPFVMIDERYIYDP